MAPNMQPEIVSREVIKPSLSIPNDHPTTHNLSFFDQFIPPFYVPLLFFYTSKHGETDNHNKSSLLKSSLSSALSRYYPLAGRLKDNVTLDCTDEGVLFLEARIGCNLSEVLNCPGDEITKRLFPDSLDGKDSFLTGPVVVQVTYFECGGLSIGLCLCHKVMDMSSMSCFILEWASSARNVSRNSSPEFDVASLYPPIDLPSFGKKPQSFFDVNKYASRRLVFDGSMIAKLKAKVADQVPNPTRVEIVASLVYKSAVFAAAKARSLESITPSVMSIVMNIRSHVSPKLPESKQGNLTGTFSVSTQDASEVELGLLVKEFKQSKARLSGSCASTRNRDELSFLLLNEFKALSEYLCNGVEVYHVTSWCRYPFYEIDFGWGKPLWFSTDCSMLKNVICLMDTKGGDGIEAYVSLEENAMAAFEQDEELLSFSQINPNIIY